ncbi:uncharacterized protein LOC132315668 isoform X1 [Cornus florida]|uniref:uncharacterized protein LOC132315668 isoform X1 n=1 Tax=Cornus florida TaxID=4283 RepID=UPI00289877EE|nr:uncharacterized protein LOC132315668 isoform X1 [Cornus florida]
METTTISLKLLVNKDTGKVLFAEAGKDFVDLLFGLLELPFGSIVALMVEHGMVPKSGSFGKIYQSVQKLGNNYLQQNQQTKDNLLRPRSASTSKHTPLLKQLAYDGHTTASNTYYGHNDNNEGYVKDVVTYMVMDDLEVKPMSTISSVTVLNTFDVKDVGALQEKTVEVDMGKGLELVKASFESTTVLTDLFLPKQGSLNGASDPTT